eukprot:scaffold487_cov178-Ochromonas_danica.AAC.15
MAVLYKTPSILDEEDIFQSILLDWLILKDLLNLDLALNRQYRLQLHTFFQSQSFKMIQPFQDKEHRNLWGKRGNLWRTHGEAIFQWMALRKVYHSQGQWEVDCWEVLSTAPSEENKNMNYRPILENMIDMRLSTLPTNFDLSQLSLCKELRRLRLRGLHAKHVSLSCQTHICPKLQSLTLERCDVSMTVIDAFAHCYDLLDMKLEYNKYMEKEKEQDLNEYTIALFARLQSLSFFGDVNELVDKFFPKGIVLSLSKLVLEGDSRTASILDLVTRCPHVRELELYSVDFSFPVALKAIRENMPQLSRLLVNGCIWTERIEDSVASAADLEQQMVNLLGQDMIVPNESVLRLSCERMVCPNDCNLSGVCYSQRQLAEDADRIYETPWDADKSYGCWNAQVDPIFCEAMVVKLEEIAQDEVYVTTRQDHAIASVDSMENVVNISHF